MSGTVHGAESLAISTASVDLRVTLGGGMVAPVVFRLGGREVSPYSLSPWTPEEAGEDLPVLLRNLRGDFLCLPFGPWEGGPPHGHSANGDWRCVVRSGSRIELRMDDPATGATIGREISLREGEEAIYHEYRINGMDGRWSYGNHPVIDFSGLPDGGGFLSVSPFRWASVYPGLFSDPARNERQALEPGARFSDLSAAPLTDGGTTDLGRYPAREGNDDLVMMVAAPTGPGRPFAWSAATLDGYVWYSLKDPGDFPATLFWLSNGGRADPPWSGRHVGRVGIEEVCSHFCDSVDVSREDRLEAEGIPTCREFDRNRETVLRIVQGVVAVPDDFGRVADIRPDGPGRVVVGNDSGFSVTAAVNWEYVVRPNH